MDLEQQGLANAWHFSRFDHRTRRHKPIIDAETAEQVLELANVTGFQSIDDLFLVPQLRSELPFEAFGTVGRITLASHNLDHHTGRWFRDLNGQIEQGNWPENFPGQELEVHVLAASRIFARIYTTAWVLWRNHRYAEEVPIESRTARNRAVQATFSLLSPDMKDAREALHVLLWRETAADFQNTPGHDGTVRRALAALSRSLTKAVASDEERPASFLLTLWAVWTKDSDTSLVDKWKAMAPLLYGIKLTLFGWSRLQQTDDNNRLYQESLRTSTLAALEQIHLASTYASSQELNKDDIRPRKRARRNPILEG
ncbi:hypothetical protein A4X13_0g7319 [Tilletia indica]|uniref:Uncharacterized protein n=1 Tax=Tilletia indica TaxID=43049 RepID=A0A177T7A6_9BASI|nr:hypothetical protein A4X13_0g7319 [Tilletia indica]